MELYRKIIKKLDIWKNGDSGLIIYGPRQVGKTYILKKYLNKNFKSVYYLNLHNNIDAIKTIVGAITPNDFISRLSLLSQTKIDEDTCIFVDEIQEYYTYLAKHSEIEQYFDIIYQVKNFVSEKYKNRIVLSGSLLRLEMDNLITSPMGYLLQIEMFPLDFEEFLINSNIDEKILNIIRECLEKYTEVPDFIHKKIIKLFNEYILVGGMPKAVSEYLTSKNFQKLYVTHQEIESFFLSDITKYVADNEKLKVREIYNLIPTELSNPTRKFIISDIPSHDKNTSEFLSFSWINKTGITIPAYLTTEPLIPLIAGSKRNQFKLFFLDVGMLSFRMFDSATKIAILDNKININKGFIFENFVAQELHAHKFDNLYYYNTRKYGEVDFLLEVDCHVLPVEIKSGKSNNYHRALNNIMDVENYNLEKAIVLTHDNVRKEEKLLYLPIYAVSFMNIFNKDYFF